VYMLEPVRKGDLQNTPLNIGSVKFAPISAM
jgi:hypothetical protein